MSSPLTWGVHVRADRADLNAIADLRGATFGISRPGSGSHLMAQVLARDAFGAAAAAGAGGEPASFAVVGNLDGARAALAAREADCYLWEVLTAKHLVDAGEWKLVGTVDTPWSEASRAAPRARLSPRARGSGRARGSRLRGAKKR